MIVNYPRMRRRAAWPDDLDTALEFSSANPFLISAPKNWDGKLEYTNGSGWKTWDGGEITSGSIENKNAIYFRGVGNTKVTGVADTSGKWVITGQNVSCNGNIERLLNWEIVESGKHPEMADSCYTSMFYGCSRLTTAPSLPATTLAPRCYGSMFYGCSSLTTAPSLPATTLASSCYAFMFYGCSRLTTAPSLPATTLAPRCYFSMFRICSSIKVSTTASGTYEKAYRIPTAGTGITASHALDYMFGATQGTFTGTPEINTTYYLDKSNTIV